MKLNQNGSSSNLLLPIVILSILLIASLIFAGWSFSGRQKYKNNTGQITASAVTAAEQQQQTKDAATYKLEAEQPLTTYDGPEAYGSLVVNYPKNWSSYVDTTNDSGSPVDGYFFPGTLPSVNDNSATNFALRIQVESNSYSDTLQQYSSQQQAGLVTVSPYSLPKPPNVVGVKVVGTLLNNKSGTLIILPLRNTAVEIWSEGNQYLTDFNNNILPNFSFSP